METAPLIRTRVFTHRCFPAAPLAALSLLAAAGCSESGGPAGQLGDSPPTPPKIQAILDSDKSPKEKGDLLRAELLGRKTDPAGTKSQSKSKKRKD